MDASLRVKGTERLRVIDASVVPTVVSGNTNATAIMIGEKGADMILRAASGPRSWQYPHPALSRLPLQQTGEVLFAINLQH